MNKNQILSEMGKKYCLKHIKLIRNFCFDCKDAIVKGKFNQAKYYKNWAHRIIKGINPFCKILEEQDRKFLSETKNQLETVLAQTEPYFTNIETNCINKIMEEVIVNTIEIEGNVMGMSFSKLSKQIFLENSDNCNLFSNLSKIL